MKLQRKPRKFIYISKVLNCYGLMGWNNNKAYVKNLIFPIREFLSLDPLGYLMRQDQHHTLNEMGVDYFASIIEYIALKKNDHFDTYFKLEGEEKSQ